MSKFWLFVYCFKKGKATVAGALVALAPQFAREVAEAIGAAGFPEHAATIVSLVGVGLFFAGFARKLAGLFVPGDTVCP